MEFVRSFGVVINTFTTSGKKVLITPYRYFNKD
jgi:hypothetical protein